MVIGLGSRSTAEIAIRIIGEKAKDGFQIVGVPTSHESEELARSLGIRVSTLAEHPQLDLTIDGADEVELNSLDLIKGRGGALLREKIVTSSSRQLIIVVDESTIVDRLGSHGELPVEVVPIAWQSTVLRLEKRPRHNDTCADRPHPRLPGGRMAARDRSDFREIFGDLGL